MTDADSPKINERTVDGDEVDPFYIRQDGRVVEWYSGERGEYWMRLF